MSGKLNQCNNSAGKFWIAGEMCNFWSFLAATLEALCVLHHHTAGAIWGIRGEEEQVIKPPALPVLQLPCSGRYLLYLKSSAVLTMCKKQLTECGIDLNTQCQWYHSFRSNFFPFEFLDWGNRLFCILCSPRVCISGDSQWDKFPHAVCGNWM